MGFKQSNPSEEETEAESEGRCGRTRARTRDLFSRPFRKKGYIPLTTYLRTYKVGHYVDIKVNRAVHKGMPHKFYHGCTGLVWSVTERAIDEINKQDHKEEDSLLPSGCNEDFKLRKIQNDKLKAEAKAGGEKISTKRQPEGPKPLDHDSHPL
ncbi:hypothetical protein SAY87_024335 [Trapa incisa]|uniref:60S ribosomal protein L21 n=1 Tax=Trapa incisa TaxID=236973 RepID=A0AAN7GKP1_9MYRT|nr:hypothetical protein SAY87_024335 [Trapa incisa]